MIGDDWTPVWCPISYVVDPTAATVHADNAMGSYYSPSQKYFVIAIAGTNPNSSCDWLDEDGAVSATIAWGTVSPGVPRKYLLAALSTGTNAGLQVLLKSTVDSGGPAMLSALKAYISAKKSRVLLQLSLATVRLERCLLLLTCTW